MSEIRWGRKGQRLIWKALRSLLKLAWLPCRGHAACRRQGPSWVGPVGLWPSHPFFWAPLVSGKGGEYWSFSWRAVMFFSYRLRMQSSNTCLSFWQQLPYFLETLTIRVGKCFRFWIQPTNWHINSLQSSLSQMPMIIKITRHLFSAYSLLFLTLWTRTSRKASEKLCV